MAFFDKLSSDSGMAALTKSLALQARQGSAISSAIPVHGLALPGTGFETLSPLAISINLLKFLKYMDLKLVGLGLSCVPFHSGWELIEWVPKSIDLGQNWVEILEICDVVEVDDSFEIFGPQIELDLGERSSIHDVGEPPVEAAGVVPTVVVEAEEESSVELVEARASVEKMVGDQAKGTGSTLVLETIAKVLGDQAVEAGGELAHETVEEITGDEPVLMDMEEARTGVVPVLEAGELRTGKEPVFEDVPMRTGNEPVHDMGLGDSHLEDYPGDDSEKVGEYTPEETFQSPSTPAPEKPVEETPASSEPRKKRIKTLAGRTHLPWVRKLTALKSKSSSSSQQTPQKQPSQPTRKSYRLAAQGVMRTSSTN